MANTFVPLLLSLLVLSCSYATVHSHYPVMAPSPAPDSHHHHRHHHHHHHHAPSPAPVPVHPPPPTRPPTHPPVHPPTAPPTKPPSHPPTKPPSHPPVHPPMAPPKYPPTKPPSHPPVHPPTAPPQHPPFKPPVHPPTAPPTKPPVHPPTVPPTKPPTHPPTAPPTKTPSYPPIFHFPRSLVAVQGVVYCKSCKHPKADTLMNATILAGARVKLVCKNTKYRPVVAQAITDKNGYFYMEAPKTITTYAAHKCKVVLVSSPTKSCSKPSDLHGGYSGATLRPKKPFVSHKFSFVLFDVGPFAFEPTCKMN